VSPSEAPEPAAAQPPAVPAQRNGAAGSLAGHSVHTVGAGECLWTIAEALLPAGAGISEIEAEVQRLWKLNAARIGTDDPNLLYVGTELRLR
jgi:nucleoid-associated protein YgaU